MGAAGSQAWGQGWQREGACGAPNPACYRELWAEGRRRAQGWRVPGSVSALHGWATWEIRGSHPLLTSCRPAILCDEGTPESCSLSHSCPQVAPLGPKRGRSSILSQRVGLGPWVETPADQQPAEVVPGWSINDKASVLWNPPRSCCPWPLEGQYDHQPLVLILDGANAWPSLPSQQVSALRSIETHSFWGGGRSLDIDPRAQVWPPGKVHPLRALPTWAWALLLF